MGLMSSVGWAQEKQVTGTVFDENGLPLPGVNIIIEGTTTGTQTDFDGNYSLRVNQGQVLLMSFVGYQTQSLTVGSSDVINATMVLDSSLSEIVITAQGIKREKKALGYAVSAVDPAVIESKPEADVSRILTGKVSGVEVNAGGGFLGSQTNVIIRSKNSISGSNQPLYVVDGAPISGGRSYDIDGSNIASLTVLKGLAASTLYGQDGRNGVIVIETKTGQAGASTQKKFEVEVSSKSSILEVANLPEFQNKYGQGADNTINTTYYGTWGAAFAGQVVPHHLSIVDYASSFPEYQGATDIYRAIPNNVSDFFDLGRGQNTSVNISKNFEGGHGVSASVGHVDQVGYIPQNSLRRLNLNFGGRTQLSNKLSLNTSVLFSNVYTRRPTRDFFTLLTWIPRNLDIHNLPFEDPNDNSSVYYRTTQANPRWLQKYTGREETTDRTYVKSDLKYNISDKSSFSYLYSIDTYNEVNHDWYNSRNPYQEQGYLRTFTETNTTTNHRVTYQHNDISLGTDLKLNVVLGAEARSKNYSFLGMFSEGEIVFNFQNHDNYTTHKPIDGRGISNTLGLYGELRVDYQDYAYLTMAGRNDWGSTPEIKNNSLFYPSASLALIPTSMFEGLADSFVDYLKLRIGFGTSANFPDPYLTRLVLDADATAFVNTFTNNNLITNSLSSFLPNPDIKPELLKEVEIGIETKLFDNFIDIEMSAYKRITKDQILSSNLAASTGYTRTIINAGRVDTDGVEIDLTLNLFQNPGTGFNWSINNQFTAYETTVVELPVDRIDISSGLNYAIEGEAYGVFRGTYYARDDEGNLLINPETGKVIFSDALGLEDKILGDPNEDWRWTNVNTFSYKNITLSMQWDYIHGGDIWSRSASNLLRRGVTRDTENREGSYILPGVLGDPNTGEPILDANGDKIANTIQIGANDLYFINLMDVDEGIIYDASVIRLRDISLSYNIPGKLLDKTPFGSGSLTFSGNNLWYRAPNLPKYMNLDPEVLGPGADNPTNGKGLDFQNDPSYKQYSLGVKLTF